jgi:Domain of unknown function (DUF4417)
METPPLRLEYRDPAELAEHPANWKAHPAEQIAGLDALIDSVGWAGALLFNEATGRLVDGHARRARSLGRGPVPVLIGSWTEAQEKLILAYLDPTGWTAVGDRAKLDALLSGDFPTVQNDELAKLLEAVKSTSRLLEPTEPGSAQDAEQLDVSLPLDSLWPTDNPWSIPSLDPALQADQVVFPVTTWGTQGARRPMTGVWNFYTADRKFEPLWRKPHRVLYSRPSAACEPNFSTTDQTPFAMSLYHVYRKRWIARYWQSQGLKIFVDLNADQGLNDPHPAVDGLRPNLLGVPLGWKAYASRAHSNRPEALEREYAVAQAHADGATPLFLVVGGGLRVKQLAQEKGWVWVPEQIQQAHAKDDDDTP